MLVNDFSCVGGGGRCRCGRHYYTTTFGGRTQVVPMYHKHYCFDNVTQCIAKCCRSYKLGTIESQYQFEGMVYDCPG